MTRSLFLQWATINAVFITALSIGAFSFRGHVPTVAKAAVGAVVVLYLLASSYAGWLTWDGGITERALTDLREAVEALPKLAMLGTVSGFLIALSASTDNVQQRVTGAATGLIATFVGIACMIALGLQVRLLERQEVAFQFEQIVFEPEDEE